MMQVVLFALVFFFLGAAFGYSVRATISMRRRAAARRS